MRKFLKIIIAALSIVLLASCSSSKTELDWTKDAKYFTQTAGQVQKYTTNESPLLECENKNAVSKKTFASFDFKGKCRLATAHGFGVSNKFSELWKTEVKDAIYDVLCNRFKEDLFEKANDNPEEISNYEYFDNFLNGFFPNVLMADTSKQGYFFSKAIDMREDGSYKMDLCKYTINFYDSEKNLVFHYEHEYYWKNI